MKRLYLSRTLLLSGLLLGLFSFFSTVSHIFDADYILIASKDAASLALRSHAKYHALREVFGDAATMSILLIVFFGSERFRNPQTWFICLLLMVGYYAPFWAGAPFSDGLSAPSLQAEIVHVSMACLSTTALFICRPAFFSIQTADSKKDLLDIEARVETNRVIDNFQPS